MKVFIPVHTKLALSLTGLLALAPFNMGGCADAAQQLGQSIGGKNGQLLGAGLGAAVKGGEAVSLSEKDEKAMGESVAMAVTTRYPIVRDEKLNQYVTLVGLTLASSSPRPDTNWLFAVVDTDEVNAFSGPNGYVMVTRGAIKQMQDESELAGVLAHEMTHVLDKHGLKAVQRAGFADAGATLAKGTRETAAFGQFANGLVDTVLVKGYGREEEDQADAGAVNLLMATGYDPAGYLHFIERMAQQQGGRSASPVFSTHPGAAERAGKIRKEIDAAGGGKGAVLKERFEKMTGIQS
jgi:beta-barrel assembly-enhancing protease